MRAKKIDEVAYSMRFPRDVYEVLRAEALRNERSLAKEMLFRLKRDLPAAKPGSKRKALEAAG